MVKWNKVLSFWWDQAWALWPSDMILFLADTKYQHRHTTQTVKYDGGSMKLWGCFLAAGPGRVVIVEGKMNAAKHRELLEDNKFPSARELWLQRTFIFQEDDDQKLPANATQKWFEDNKVFSTWQRFQSFTRKNKEGFSLHLIFPRSQILRCSGDLSRLYPTSHPMTSADHCHQQPHNPSRISGIDDGLMK